MISVIAPNLNEEKYLPRFLVSLLSQSYKNFEVIIVDGGSIDQSPILLILYRDLFRQHGIKMTLIRDKTRNLGYIRNVGAKHASGNIYFHCNTDNVFEPFLLQRIARYYEDHPELFSLSGRVHPIGTSIFAHLGYQAFDLLRFIFTCAPMPIKKYRPSGNFMTIRAGIFEGIGGYPHAAVNEDGLIGQKLDAVIPNHKSVVFNLNLWVGHHVKKFESMGGIQALLFYLYTLTNFAPILKPLLEPIRRNASLTFQGKPVERLNFKTMLKNFWNWL